MKFLAGDPSTRVVLGYLEGISDGKSFIEVAGELPGKNLYHNQIGWNSGGRKGCRPHTREVLPGLKDQFVLRSNRQDYPAETVSELFDYALAFASQPVAQGQRIAILTNSGGPGIMAADAIERYGLYPGFIYQGNPGSTSVCPSRNSFCL